MKQSKRNAALAEKAKQGPPPVSKYAAKRKAKLVASSPFGALAGLKADE